MDARFRVDARNPRWATSVAHEKTLSKKHRPEAERGRSSSRLRDGPASGRRRSEAPSAVVAAAAADERFETLLDDPDAHATAPVDKFGRKIPAARTLNPPPRIDDEEEEEEDQEEEVEEEQKEEEEKEEDEPVEMEAELDEAEEKEEVEMGEETRRLAVVHQDWSRLSAVDFLAVLQSFLPPRGRIAKVSIVPSEYGHAQMAEEDARGPGNIWRNQLGRRKRKRDAASSSTNKSFVSAVVEQEAFDPELLRKYELQKLRYFYALVECDCKETALALYQACDHMELETSANRLDLRFVPDDFEPPYAPRDEATAVPKDYESPSFFTRALQHTNVTLTWDEDMPHRSALLNYSTFMSGRNVDGKKIDYADLEQFVASSASSDADSDDDADGNDPEDLEREIRESGLTRAQYLDLRRRVLEERVRDKEAKAKDRYAALRNLVDGSAGAAVDRASGGLADGDGPLDMQITFTSGMPSGHAPAAADGFDDDSDGEGSPMDAPEEEHTGRRAKEVWRERAEKEKADKAERGKKSKKSKKKGGKKDAPDASTAAEQRRAMEELQLLMLPETFGGGEDRESVDKSHAKVDKETRAVERAVAAAASAPSKRARREARRQERQASARDAEGFEFDAADPRLAELYTSSHFALDPTETAQRKSLTERTFAAIQRRRGEATPSTASTADPDALGPLVRSVLAKRAAHSNQKKG
jgi:hypothetical protein